MFTSGCRESHAWVDIGEYISDITHIPYVLRFKVKMWCQGHLWKSQYYHTNVLQ